MSERIKDGYFAIGLILGISVTIIGILVWDVFSALIKCRAESQCFVELLSSPAPLKPDLLKMGQSLVSFEDTLANWLSALISLAAVIVSAVAVLFVKKTLDATLKTALASTNATMEMVESNRIQRSEKRPWCVIIWDTACEFHEREKDYFSLKWNYQHLNRGKGIAHNVRFLYDVYRYDWGYVGAGRAGVEDILRRARGYTSTGEILFPGEQTSFLSLEGWNMEGKIRGEDTGTLFLCACVIYDLDETGMHQGYEAIAMRIKNDKDNLGSSAAEIRRVSPYTLRA